MNELARSATRKKVHRRGSDFCGTAAAAASEQVLPAGSLSATISGEATTDAAPGSFFSVLSSDIADRREGLEIWLAAAVQTDACLKCGAFLEFLDERGADHFVELAKDVRDAQQSDASPRASHPHVEGDRAYVTLRGGDCGALRLGLDKALGPAFARRAAGETPRLFPGVSQRRNVMDDEYARLGVFDDARWRVVDNATYEPHAEHHKDRAFHVVAGAALCAAGAAAAAAPAALGAASGGHKDRHALAVLGAIRRCGLAGASLAVVDARPYANALANTLKGGGFEDAHDIPGGGTVYFANIPNIHAMRQSLAKLRRACEKNDGDFLEEVHGSRWLDNLRLVLAASTFVAKLLHVRKTPTLVHCSDGWDRTSQLSSLAQLLLDPYYRTVAGFGALVEKDWCAFGYQFSKRRDAATDDHSPIFLQWLDCVWQALRQHPTRFEFNELFLLAVRDAVYAQWHSTFRGDCDAQRDADFVDLWPALAACPALRSGAYDAGDGALFLKVDYSAQAVTLWARCHVGDHPPRGGRALKLKVDYSAQAVKLWARCHVGDHPPPEEDAP
ncbi:phosphatidylinositol-3,5-bisphosphate 3-phosphatase [Aureococcus anophagefferens]|nr:phosphatidylinositol-3,5-bisphosphate 3-phosphatase [Aureococcus anophagefferens]